MKWQEGFSHRSSDELSSTLDEPLSVVYGVYVASVVRFKGLLELESFDMVETAGGRASGSSGLICALTSWRCCQV